MLNYRTSMIQFVGSRRRTAPTLQSQPIKFNSSDPTAPLIANLSGQQKLRVSSGSTSPISTRAVRSTKLAMVAVRSRVEPDLTPVNLRTRNPLSASTLRLLPRRRPLASSAPSACPTPEPSSTYGSSPISPPRLRPSPHGPTTHGLGLEIHRPLAPPLAPLLPPAPRPLPAPSPRAVSDWPPPSAPCLCAVCSSAAQPAALRRPPTAPGPDLIHVTTSSHAPPPSSPPPRPSSPSPLLPLPRPSGATTSRGGACRGQARTVAGVAVRHRGRAGGLQAKSRGYSMSPLTSVILSY
jgi:hypothetical protein